MYAAYVDRRVQLMLLDGLDALIGQKPEDAVVEIARIEALDIRGGADGETGDRIVPGIGANARWCWMRQRQGGKRGARW